MIDIYDCQSRAYWQPLRRRLEALGADIEDDGLGTWMDAVDDTFGPAQRFIGLRACHTAPPAERWLLVNGWGASQALLDGEPLGVADSLTDALACVLTQAIELRELPNDVSMDENATVRLLRAGRLLVEVRRWQPPPTPSAQAELAARTLFDLRRSTAPFFELVERLRRWPGLHDLAMDPAERRWQVSALRKSYLPNEADWLRSATQLANALSMPPDVPAQSVAAAVLCAPGWDTLLTRVRAHQAAATWPWAIMTPEGRGAGQAPSVYANAQDAFGPFAASVARMVGADAGLCFDVADSSRAMPRFMLRRRRQVPDEWADSLLELAMVPRIEPDAESPHRAAIEAMRNADGALTEEGLEELFLAQQSTGARLASVDRITRSRLLVQDGPWRFTRCTIGREACVCIERIDASGNRVGQEAISSLAKAQIYAVGGPGSYAICSDWSGRHPIAILRLARSSAVLLASTFPEMRRFDYGIPRLRQGDPDVAAELARLSRRGGL